MHSRRKNITHADVERALARFRQEGRGITRLEPQATPRRSSVRDPAGGVDNLLDQVLPEMAASYGSERLSGKRYPVEYQESGTAEALV